MTKLVKPVSKAEEEWEVGEWTHKIYSLSCLVAVVDSLVVAAAVRHSKPRN